MSSQSPQPSTWGSPKAFWSSSTCPTKSFFGAQRIVINTTLCGDWAGSAYSSDPTCPGTCAERVADPSNFDSELGILFLSLNGVPSNTRLIVVIASSIISCAVENPLCHRLPVKRSNGPQSSPYFAPTPTRPFPFLHSSSCINRRFVSFQRLQNHQPSFKTLSAMWLCPERKRRTYVAPVARSLFFSWFVALPLHSHFLYHLIFPPIAVYIFFCCICTNVLSFHPLSSTAFVLQCLFFPCFLFGAGRACMDWFLMSGLL